MKLRNRLAKVLLVGILLAATWHLHVLGIFAPRFEPNARVDREVLMTALTHFAAQPESDRSRDSEPNTIFINQQTSEMRVSAGYVDRRSWPRMWQLADSFEAQNPHAQMLGWRDSVGFKMFDGEATPRWSLREKADFRCFVDLSKPGYSRNGRLAMVRFSFGPSGHGAIASYLLILENGRWRVQFYSCWFYA